MGRPRISIKEKKNVSVSIRLSDKEKAIMKSKNISPTKVLRKELKKWLQ